MNYKIKGAMKKNKIPFIVCIILWLVLTIVFVVPLSISINNGANNSSIHGKFDTSLFFETFLKLVTMPFSNIQYISKTNAIGTFISTEIGFTIIYAIVFFIGFMKSRPKHEYEDIEHGSSDWSKHGEQYQILNKNKGIILAEENYLPVDKRGNVNVLVVGRIRIR